MSADRCPVAPCAFRPAPRMALGSAAILKVLKEHADGKFESRLDPKGLKGDDRELAIWLNDYAEKQRAADQVLQKAVNQAGARLLHVVPYRLERYSRAQHLSVLKVLKP